jgi:hypothetical protein
VIYRGSLESRLGRYTDLREDTSIPRSHEPSMTDQSKLVSRPWRRFLRFSVRGLIVLVLVIGGWLGWIVRSARIQHNAVASIKRAGGTILYERNMQMDERMWLRDRWVMPPKWLVDRLGIDYFSNVEGVVLRNTATRRLCRTRR